MTRKRAVIGAVVTIHLTDRIAFGRLVEQYEIAIYDFSLPSGTALPAIEEIIQHKVAFYCGLHKSVMRDEAFEIIGVVALTQEETSKIPPHFIQDLMNINKCVIYGSGYPDRPALPAECVGLERGGGWEARGVQARIEDYFAGRKNWSVELRKPILSESDPRYLTPLHLLKWDKVNELFHRID